MRCSRVHTTLFRSWKLFQSLSLSNLLCTKELNIQQKSWNVRTCAHTYNRLVFYIGPLWFFFVVVVVLLLFFFLVKTQGSPLDVSGHPPPPQMTVSNSRLIGFESLTRWIIKRILVNGVHSGRWTASFGHEPISWKRVHFLEKNSFPRSL